MSRSLAWVGGSGSSDYSSGLLLISCYFWVAGAWWRLYFQEVATPASRGADEPTLRRWLVRGRVIWIAIAYVVVVGSVIVPSGDGSGDSGDDGGSWLGLIVFLALPFGLAWFAALVGRFFADQAPVRR